MPYYRKNLIVLWGTIFLASASWNQIVPFLPKYLKTMGMTGIALHNWSGVIFAVPAIASIVCQPYWIKLGDKWGRKPMIIRAGICLSVLYYLMSICRNPWELAVCRFLNGALTGFIPGSIALIATNTPQEEAPRSLALAQSATATGQIAGPTMGLILFIVCHGYRGSMQISALATAIATILVIFLVQEPNKVEITKQTSMIQDVITGFRSKLLIALMLPVFLEGAFATGVNSQMALHLPLLSYTAPAWYHGVNWQAVTVSLQSGWLRGINWLPIINKLQNIDWLQGMVYSGPALAVVCMAYWWSRIAEKIGYKRTFHIGLIGTAIFALSITFVRNIWLLLPLYMMCGVFLASIFPSMGTALCKDVDEEFRARAYGLLNANLNLGAFLCPFATAWVAGYLGTRFVFTFVAILFAAGATVYPIMMRRSKEFQA